MPACQSGDDTTLLPVILLTEEKNFNISRYHHDNDTFFKNFNPWEFDQTNQKCAVNSFLLKLLTSFSDNTDNQAKSVRNCLSETLFTTGTYSL